jgi:uncharacterized protein (DUF952 family)
MILYHITSAEEWQQALKSGQYLPADYAKDGFIHASFREQVTKTGNRFYSGKTGLILLKIDSTKLSSPIKVEKAETGEEFPHIYGPLFTSAVLAFASFVQAPSGDFQFPASLEK